MTKEFDDLPPEVRSQLIGDKLRETEETIVETLKDLGGHANLDALIVALWRNHQIKIQRQTLNATLNRLAARGFVARERKGTYSVVAAA